MKTAFALLLALPLAHAACPELAGSYRCAVAETDPRSGFIHIGHVLVADQDRYVLEMENGSEIQTHLVTIGGRNTDIDSATCRGGAVRIQNGVHVTVLSKVGEDLVVQQISDDGGSSVTCSAVK